MTLPKLTARRLGHAVLSSSDLERDITYYAEVIGLFTRRQAGSVRISCDFPRIASTHAPSGRGGRCERDRA